MRSMNSRRLTVALCLVAVPVGLSCNEPRPTSSSPIVVSDDGSSVWVVNPDSNTVGKIDTASATLIEEVAVGDNPRTLALTRDSEAPSKSHPFWNFPIPNKGKRRVFVANQDSDSISRVNIKGHGGKYNVKELQLPHGSAPYGVALTPDNKLLLVNFTGFT